MACLDYRNFPQGSVSCMVDDVAAGTAFVVANAPSWGGDPCRVFLVGQSAGAHLAALALLRETSAAEWEASGGCEPLASSSSSLSSSSSAAASPPRAEPTEPASSSAPSVLAPLVVGLGLAPRSPRSPRGWWRPVPRPCRFDASSLAGFVGVSGVYAPDDEALLQHFASKGLDRPLLWAIMEAGLAGDHAAEAMPASSPVTLLARGGGRGTGTSRDDGPGQGDGPDGPTTTSGVAAPGAAAAGARRVPPVTLLHGTADASAPASQSASFAAALRSAGAPSVAEIYYPGKSHTDPFLEDPILGGHDALLEDILKLARAPQPYPSFPRMLPAPVVELARWCIPF